MVNPFFATAVAPLSFRGLPWVSVQQTTFQSLTENGDGARQPANLRGVQDPRRYARAKVAHRDYANLLPERRCLQDLRMDEAQSEPLGHKRKFQFHSIRFDSNFERQPTPA
jgi:hypothetical protein